MELGLMNIFVKAVNVKFSILFPAIVMFCVLGVFALNNRTFDIWILIVTGILAYILDQLGVDMAPIILGFILGPLIEKYYRMGMISENGNFSMILQRPIAVVCLIISLLFVFVPLSSKKIRQKKIGLNI
jgi:putative tricarboxylic transport membrane protein